MSNRCSSVSRCLFFLIVLLTSTQAFAYYGATDVQYATSYGVLSGYSVTWKDPWDVSAGATCLQYSSDMVTCAVVLYYEMWVSLDAKLYAPSGSLLLNAYEDDFYFALVPYSVINPAAGVWTGIGNHYLEQDIFVGYDLWGYWMWSFVDTIRYPLGQTGAQRYVQRLDDAERLLTDGSLGGAVLDWSYSGNGNYEVTLSGPAFGFAQAAGLTLLRIGPCVIGGPVLCAIVNGVGVVATVVMTRALVIELHNWWRQRVDSPFGWPGDDPAKAPGEEWVWKPDGSPVGSREGNWWNPATGESLHPDLNHPEPKGKHWDYRDRNGKWWDIWPDGKMTPHP